MHKSIIIRLTILAIITGSMHSAVAEMKGKTTVFYNPSQSKLTAPALTADLTPATGKNSYENDGDYIGILVDLPLAYDRFFVHGDLLVGGTDTIAGGNFTDPNYDWTDWMNFRNANPLTAEDAMRLNVFGGYRCLENSDEKTGKTFSVDLMAGYWYLDSRPTTSKANVYGGIVYGVRGRYGWKVGTTDLNLEAVVSYVPTYDISGNVDGSLSEDKIFMYRLAAECVIVDSYALTVGWQGLQLDAGTIKDGGKAKLTLDGFLVGVSRLF